MTLGLHCPSCASAVALRAKLSQFVACTNLSVRRSNVPVTVGVAEVGNMQKVANWTDVLSYHTSVPLSQPTPPTPRATHLGSAPNGNPSELEFSQMGQPSGFRVTDSGRDAWGDTYGITRRTDAEVAGKLAAVFQKPVFNSQSGCTQRSKSSGCCLWTVFNNCNPDPALVLRRVECKPVRPACCKCAIQPAAELYVGFPDAISFRLCTRMRRHGLCGSELLMSPIGGTCVITPAKRLVQLSDGVAQQS